MPPLHLILDLVLGAILPAFGVSVVVTAAVIGLLGTRHVPVAAALGLSAGAALGLWLREALTLVPGDSPWNRLPWAALAALWVGRVARLPDLQPSAGWFLRAAAAVGIAWMVIPAETRQEIDSL